MALLQDWREYAYSEEMQNSKEGEKLWENYFTLEKGIYEKLLSNPDEVVEGSVEAIYLPIVLIQRNRSNLYDLHMAAFKSLFIIFRDTVHFQVQHNIFHMPTPFQSEYLYAII